MTDDMVLIGYFVPVGSQAQGPWYRQVIQNPRSPTHCGVPLYAKPEDVKRQMESSRVVGVGIPSAPARK